MPNTRKCEGCGALMLWVQVPTKDGKDMHWMPLDAEPAANGRWFVNENMEPPTARYVGVNEADYRKYHDQKLLHMPHHATCPKAKDFQKHRGTSIGTKRSA